MLGTKLVSKRLRDANEIIVTPNQNNQGANSSKILAIYRSNYYIRSMINHCLYQRKDGFEKIIQTYLSTQRLSDFENSFCKEIEKLSLDYERFLAEFLVDQESILEINSEATQLGNLIHLIIVDFNYLMIKEIDGLETVIVDANYMMLHSTDDFLNPDRFFEKTKENWEQYKYIQKLNEYKRENIKESESDKDVRQRWESKKFSINTIPYNELSQKLDDCIVKLENILDPATGLILGAKEFTNPDDLKSILNYKLMNPIEYKSYQSSLNYKFMEHIEYINYQSIIFDYQVWQFKKPLVAILRNYLNEFDTLQKFQEELDNCWFNASIMAEKVKIDWWKKYEQERRPVRGIFEQTSIGFPEFLYQITNTLYFVDLELDLEDKNHYKINQKQFQDYLKNLLPKLENFLQD